MPTVLGIVLGVAGALAVVLALVLIRFALAQRRLTHLRTGGRIADTAMGPVEYASVGPRSAAGDEPAPVVMLLHGGLGGWDQGLAMGEDLGIPDAFTLLAPSRAGYLGTPLTTCATPAEAADAMAALLDALGIDKAAVIGLSGGGPTSLEMALRHPDRVSALITMVAITGEHVQPEMSTRGIGGFLIFSDAGQWLIDLLTWVFFVKLFRWLPRTACRLMFKATEDADAATLRRRVDEVMREPAHIDWMHRLMDHILPISARKTGLDNDLKEFARAPVYPVERITCPTLAVYGEHDGNVPPAHGRFIAEGVPGAESYMVPGVGHLIWMSEHVDEVRRRTLEFLERHARG